jgi:T5SS/PEP-CTERM-associated repeat protein
VSVRKALTMRISKITSLSLAVAAISLVSATAHASTRDWAESRGALMTKSDAWKPFGMPTKKDIARFNLSSAYTISFKSNVTNMGLLIGNDKLVFDFGQCTYSLAPTRRNSVYLGLAKKDVARVTLRNGNLNSGPSTVGGVAGSSGNVTLANTAAWNANGLLAIGGYGSGGLTVIGGGKLASTTGGVGMYGRSKGNVLLSGDGSDWNVAGTLAVGGKTSTGQVNIRDNASLNVGDKLDIRKGSALTLNGGSLSAASIIRPRSVVFQSGTLNLTKSNLTIGTGGTLGAAVILDPKQTLNVSQDVTVNGVTGSLDLSGGRFSARRTLNSGTINFRSGEFHGTLVNSAASSAVNITATVAVFANDVVNNGTFSVGEPSKARFEANVSGSRGFTGGGEITFAGTYNPGTSDSQGLDAPVSFRNNIIFTPEARLRLNLGGPSRSFVSDGIAYDRVDVNGQIHLTNVDIALAGTPALQVGDRFDLVTGSIVYDKNFHISLPNLSGGRSFDVIRGNTSLSAVIIPEPAIGTLLAGAAAAMAFCRPRRRR